MRNLWFAMASVLIGAALSFAAEHDQHDHSAVSGAPKAAVAPALAPRTCPVTGEPIQQDVYTDYDGSRVYFCCSACIAKFKASPMKYLPAVYQQAYPQTVQVTCPVMGDSVDGKTFVDFKGQRVGFCCNDCPNKFNADPTKYMEKLKKASTDQVHDPVTGKGIDLRFNVEHEGKIVFFSSEDALAKFKADPGTYTAALRTEAGVVARGPTANDDLFLALSPAGEASVYKRKDLKAVAYEGKTFLLRGDDGVKSFQANPAKYAKALDAEMQKRAKSQSGPMPGMGDDTMHGGNMNHAGMNHGGMKHGSQNDGHAGHH